MDTVISFAIIIALYSFTTRISITMADGYKAGK